MARAVAFLWHMHQPSYEKDGVLQMPWVFLHSIKDYYDMPWIAAKESVKVTFNLTPTLLEQISLYQKGAEVDRFLTLLLQKEPEDRDFILKVCKSTRSPMRKGFWRYEELYQKDELTEQELLDCEVLFLLCWCGNFLRQNNALVQKLIQKQQHFTYEEKISLIEELLRFVSTIIPFYAKLYKEKKIDLSTTPYYHPIVPLLLDVTVAKEADPTIELPHNPISLQDDAKLHIQKSITLFERLFGSAPKGFWPAEGAVDAKSAALYKEHGIEWIATDEAILKKSGHTNIYTPYSYQDMTIFFRDHTLSDLIGFTYKNIEAKEAAQDFTNRIESIDEELVTIIVDGENAWEYYPDNGYPFLTNLYHTLAKTTRFVGMSDAKRLKAAKLQKLAPGSWIYANFNTWIGDEEKNRAWELLFATKREALRVGKEDPLVTQHFLEAECSDWFWWYGKGHYTEYAKEFDELYRSHLIAIYHLLGLPHPKALDIPIVGAHSLQTFINKPKNYIYPVIDGKVTSFFEWLGAGFIDERAGATMQQVTNIIDAVYYGQNEELFFLRLDGDMQKVKNATLHIYFEQKELPFIIAVNSIAEIAIDKKSFSGSQGVIEIVIEKSGTILQMLPSLTTLVVDLNEDYTKNWFI